MKPFELSSWRSALRTGGTIAVMAFAWIGSGAFGGEADRRPNILFAFADDWGRHASAYAAVDGLGTANDILSTPNFDRVAREGVLFRNAFVNAPSCTPCRSALLSGQYFWRTGRAAILQGARWDPEIPSFPLMLRDAGYHIGQTSKVWSPGTPNDAPFGGDLYAYDSAGGRFNAFSQNVTRMVGGGMSVDAAKARLLGEVRENFEAFLAGRGEGQPFLYWWGPTLVHRKWERGSGKALWGLDPDALQGRMPPFLPDVPVVREDLADYFGEIQAFDAGLGVLLRKLEETGELRNTIVVVSGDHGAPGFPNGKCSLYDFGVGVPLAIRWPGKRGGRVLEDFVNLMDLAPTFLEMAGVTVPSVMTGRSLLPQLRATRGGWVDPDRDWVITGRERHVARARAGEVPYPQRALRTRDYLYIHNFRPDRWPMGDPFHVERGGEPSESDLTGNTFVTYADFDASPTKAWLVANREDPRWRWHHEVAFGRRPREELYDLARDPWQVRNVAEDPAYEAVKDTLRGRLMGELGRLGDPRLIDEGAFFETPPMAGPVTGD